MNGQQKRVYRERKEPGFCSSSITMLKGGEFVYERGCEESSYVCFGTWFKNGKKVRLVPVVNFTYNIGFKVDTISKIDSIPKIKVFDIDSVDITDKMKFTFIDPIMNEATWLDISANHIAGMKGRVLIYTLQQIFLRPFEFYNNLNNDINIHLRIKGDFIYNGNSKWEEPRFLELSIEGNCLRNLTNTYYCSE